MATDWGWVEQALGRQQIMYNPNSPYEPFSFELEQTVVSLGFYRVHVKLGHFALAVSVLRHRRPNIFASEQHVRSTYGTVYFARLGSQALCFKSFGFGSKCEFRALFGKVVKEWSILRVSAALECSPLIEQQLGFDIVVYDDCLQYATERGHALPQLTLREAQLLKEELVLLHRLRVIHSDVKPENIVFSSAFQKPVLIDFGLSEVVEEECGFKTVGGFRGTPNYCSPEMFALMMQGRSYVDLYYNDAHCLGLTLRHLKCDLVLEEHGPALIELGQRREATFSLFAFQYHYLQANESASKKYF
jgi:hypothetical protein